MPCSLSRWPASFAVNAGNGRSPGRGSARRWARAPVHGYAGTLIMAGADGLTAIRASWTLLPLAGTSYGS